MMVTFVSQCEKNALKKTRRVLDAFANRIGDNTWQALITSDGLLTVKKMLRKTASKSTAVSCHWLRSRSRSQLLWVVGNRAKFNAEGVVPVNSTQRNLLTSDSENDWHYLPLIKGLTALAALLHDWGKATALFQNKLHPDSQSRFKGDPIRHEWISLLLLHAHVQATDAKTDEQWLSALSHAEINESKLKKFIQADIHQPLTALPPIAKLVAWLIVSHHRLPLPSKEVCGEYRAQGADSLEIMLSRVSKEWGYQNRYDEQDYQQRLKKCFRFPNGLLNTSKLWMQQVKKWATKLLQQQQLAHKCINDGSYRLVLGHARLCLMLGDHFYSSQQADQKWPDSTGLYANTDRQTNTLKQKLDEHLVGVARNALKTAHLLPAFETEPPLAQDIESLRKPSPKAYQWQDKAVDKITTWRKELEKQSKQKYGFFTVNLASTGCGKTFANAKVMRALSADSQSLRFVLALGLRTLTLQTGDEYRSRVGLDDSELAVLIGSRAVIELHQQRKAELDKNSVEHTGSSSQETLLDEELDFDCSIPEQGLSTVLTCNKDKQFLYAPVLACTIDHLMAATETKRGGRYILPTLRLMSSDLVIDEIDDFTGNDLIAIGRLIHLAGMLGRKVMISSATIPPFMAEGYFKAYRDGWQLYCQTRSANLAIGCAWIDEFSTQVTTNRGADAPEAIALYQQEHERFISKRIVKLMQQPAKRKADISLCQQIVEQHEGQQHRQQSVIESKQQVYFNVIAQSALQKHERHHYFDTDNQLKVSFGVVRVANISPCVALTKYLLEKDWPLDTEVRVMAYHSQQVLLMRSIQEQHLDQVLKRKEATGQPPQALSNPIIRRHLTTIAAQSESIRNVLFILVATPVEEVGRDHDLDWAVIEPSSYRSIIQLAGRVKRHREGAVNEPNIALLQYNWKAIRDHHLDHVSVFTRPGYEDVCPLASHDLTKLINVRFVAEGLNSIPRIKMPQVFTVEPMHCKDMCSSLIELEHYATWRWLANHGLGEKAGPKGPETLSGWLTQHWFLSAIAQQLTPFRQSKPSIKAFLVFDSELQRSRFCEKDAEGYAIERESILNIERVALSEKSINRLWLVRDYDSACAAFAQNTIDSQQPLSQRRVSLRYGELSFPYDERNKYAYNDQLGLVKI
ncbi:type I-F CRISPR-associated helicase Cas3f [Aliidiomarina maris]|uniref:CRISPR-associated Cas3 family helicase n=1 Tax=Aliidiomarina maris TaxID=531312 RepID=A0A327X2F9_9GAMM|nr:type I-F CRISPR-associated helicase Cas3f [Aliidiomarina maris]RAK00598.1 CRISPR-associated Cas3 family helicase [Aliidiomarina maris]RUO27390.1 type I-F CRISPR-associated helicase Cas3 [Aliidiomarina maris]